jgi:hypothetical protein
MPKGMDPIKVSANNLTVIPVPEISWGITLTKYSNMVTSSLIGFNFAWQKNSLATAYSDAYVALHVGW